MTRVNMILKPGSEHQSRFHTAETPAQILIGSKKFAATEPVRNTIVHRSGSA